MHKNFTFIHIGKCGGSTIATTLKNNQINFDYVHVSREFNFKFQSDKKYLIAIRNPVERFVSAFYWRKYLALDRDKNRFDGECEFFQKFATIEDLIDDDISILQKQYVHHIKEDIDFYLRDFVNECDPTNIKGIISTENLNKDFERIFNIKIKRHEKNNSERKKSLKEEYRKFLKKYLHKDYSIIEKLNNLKLLSMEQYEMLAK